jgi:hypothetical protein
LLAPFQPGPLFTFLKASTETVSPIEDDQIGAALFADENKDARGQRHKIDKENGWPERQPEA